jgi:hypothetical protein
MFVVRHTKNARQRGMFVVRQLENARQSAFSFTLFQLSMLFPPLAPLPLLPPIFRGGLEGLQWRQAAVGGALTPPDPRLDHRVTWTRTSKFWVSFGIRPQNTLPIMNIIFRTPKFQ